MHRLGIGMVAIVLVIALSVFCSGSFAESQGQALIDAAKKGDLEQIRDLLAQGADVNANNGGDETALQHAAWNGNLEVVKVLIDNGADVNATCVTGLTVLMSAVQGGRNLDIVTLLVGKGADTKARYSDGHTVLMAAAWGGNLDVVKILIEKASASTPEVRTATR